MRRFIRITVCILVVLLIAGCIAGFFVWREYRKCEESPEKPELLSSSPAPAKGVSLAEKFQYVYKIRTPWGCRFSGADVTPGKGSQEADLPSASVEKRKWGKLLWTVSVPVQAYEGGTIPEGKAVLQFQNNVGKNFSVSVKLPGFKSIPGAPDGELKIADAMEIVPPAKKYKSWIIGGCIALVLAGLLVWYILRRKKQGPTVREPAPWELALNSISRLREELSAGKETPETAVGRLTDVVRHYLEKRFRFRAEHQTTREFLRELDRENSPLDLEKRGFLRDFLSSADMVKFAKLPADRSLFEHAAGKAEELVKNTKEENTETNK